MKKVIQLKILALLAILTVSTVSVLNTLNLAVTENSSLTIPDKTQPVAQTGTPSHPQIRLITQPRNKPIPLNSPEELYLKNLTTDQLNNVAALAAEGIVIGDFSQSKPGDDQQIIVRARSLATVSPYATLQPAPTGKKLYEIEYAYGIDKITNKGEGQTITILIPAGSVTLEADLKVFSAAMKIPDAQIEFIYPQGKPTKTDDSCTRSYLRCTMGPCDCA